MYQAFECSCIGNHLLYLASLTFFLIVYFWVLLWSHNAILNFSTVWTVKIVCKNMIWLNCSVFMKLLIDCNMSIFFFQVRKSSLKINRWSLSFQQGYGFESMLMVPYRHCTANSYMYTVEVVQSNYSGTTMKLHWKLSTVKLQKNYCKLYFRCNMVVSK